MTMNELLRTLIGAADDVGRTFDHAATATWPQGAYDILHRLGILRRSSGSIYATCPNCDEGHAEPVTMIGERFYVSCPEALLVEVQPEMCERWEIDPVGMAGAVANMLGLKTKLKEIVVNRFWQLGTTPWPPGPEKKRPIVLICRLGSSDTAELVRRVPMDGRTIVLVPDDIPSDHVWPGKRPPVIPLSNVLSWSNGLSLDVEVLMDLVHVADNTPYMAGGLELTHHDLQLMIRRQVKADKLTDISDEVILQALNAHAGNARAATKALNDEGYSVHHSTVSRKFARLRKTHDIDRVDDSAGVSRSVASQPRDRVKKILTYR